MGALTLAFGCWLVAASAGHASRVPQAAPATPDRGVAYGLLLDSPPPAAVLDRGIALADALRRRYGIDTGDVLADRREAARRAWVEVLEPLTFAEAKIRAAASALGYSLDPARCRNTCTHVRALSILELQKRALAAFAAGVETTTATDPAPAAPERPPPG